MNQDKAAQEKYTMIDCIRHALFLLFLATLVVVLFPPALAIALVVVATAAIITLLGAIGFILFALIFFIAPKKLRNRILSRKDSP